MEHTLNKLASVERGTGSSDFVDALTVAVDLIVKAGQERVIQPIPKNLILISNLAQQVGVGVGKGWLKEEGRVSVVLRGDGVGRWMRVFREGRQAGGWVETNTHTLTHTHTHTCTRTTGQGGGG